MTTPEDSKPTASSRPGRPAAEYDQTIAYGQYAGPVDGSDSGDHYYTHGSEIRPEFNPNTADSFDYNAGALHQPDGEHAAGTGYGFEHGSDCGCGAHDVSDAGDTGSARSARGRKLPAVSRRRFIQGLAVVGTVGVGVVRGAKPVEQQGIESQVAARAAATGGPPSTVADAAPEVVAADLEAALGEVAIGEIQLVNAAPVDQRVLVLIEFQGGNDGLSMVVPYGVNAYYDQRPNLAIAAEDVLPIDDQVGLNPELARLHQRQVRTVEGVGPVDGVLSHFEMVERWEQGDMRGLGGQRAGFLARLSDAVDAGAAVTGLSVAGHTPRFSASQSSTLALSNLNQLRVLTNDDWIYPRYRSAVRSFGGGPMSTLITDSWNKLFDVGDSINSDIEKIDNDSLMIQEGAQLGRQLAMAAEMVKADVGVRVIHASLGGFDTHDGHNGRHSQLMRRFDAAVGGFLQEIDNAGMADRVLVATSSEFGRRVRENGSGLDHGAASSMLLIGPITGGRAGDPSPVGDLDGNGNLRTTVPFDRYLATLSQSWLGVEAASILPEAPEPLDLV